MNIYVGNLSFDESDETLETAFAPHGEVQSARVITDRYSGRSRGFGFVEMPNQDEAEAAIAALNGTELNGRMLTVNESRPREGGRGGDGGRAAATAVAAATVVVAVAAVVDTAGVPAGRLDRNDSDYRCARLEEADGRVGDSPLSWTASRLVSSCVSVKTVFLRLPAGSLRHRRSRSNILEIRRLFD